MLQGGAATLANPQVLEFYKELPFNYHQSPAAQARAIQARSPVDGYPVLKPLVGPGVRVIDVGCGAGWFSLGLAVHHRCAVTAIDFNPVAIERGQEMARLLGEPVRFEVADLFLYEPAEPFDIVISIGALHHTNGCIAAVNRLCESFLRPGGHIFLGLYHAHGRRPFLDHFARLKSAGQSEDQLFAEYRRLHAALRDDTFARSWFRDQVLHPHETQHTLAELLPVFDRHGVELTSTSINGFAAYESVDDLLAQEQALAARGEAALAQGRYFPGFFLVLGRKRADAAA